MCFIIYSFLLSIIIMFQWLLCVAVRLSIRNAWILGIHDVSLGFTSDSYRLTGAELGEVTRVPKFTSDSQAHRCWTLICTSARITSARVPGSRVHECQHHAGLARKSANIGHELFEVTLGDECPEWLNRQGGCPACWRLQGCKIESRLWLRAPIYTMHEELRGYCTWGWGVRIVNWIYHPWAIVRSWLWSTATRSTPLGYFSYYCKYYYYYYYYYY